MQDVISLVVQGAGGGIAATAPDLNGANMVGDICLSLRKSLTDIGYGYAGSAHYARRDCLPAR